MAPATRSGQPERVGKSELMAKPAIQMRRSGSTLLPVGALDEARIKALPEMVPVAVKITRPRNPKVHRSFFQAIAEALVQWPHGAEPYPAPGDEEMLRAWLLCRVRQCHTYDFPLTGDPVADGVVSSSVVKLIESVRADDKFAFVRQGAVDGSPAIRVFVPKSINWDEIDELAFRPIKDGVFAEIEHILGCPIDHLLVRVKDTVMS